MKPTPNPSEIYRYLGVSSPDPETKRMVAECSDLLVKQTEARFVHMLYGITVEKERVLLADHAFLSASLAKHLLGCTHAVLLAMTLGTQTDRLLARYSLTNIAKAAVLQATAAALVEAACNDYCDELAKLAKAGKFTGSPAHLTARFSPGYGDMPLHYQKDVLELLNAPVRIGLTATDSFMLAPSKSVTAFVGVSPVPIKSCYGECELCGKHDCAFRKPDLSE